MDPSARHQEWLTTNGTGGFAMGTAAGLATRRYHGCLTIPLPNGDRLSVLARTEEEFAGQSLATVQYPGVLVDDGERACESFTAHPIPSWTLAVPGGRLEKRLFLVPGRPVAVLRYCSSVAGRLRVRLFFSLRSYHGLRQADGNAPVMVAETQELVTLIQQGLPRCHIRFPGAGWNADGLWYHRQQYVLEQERGLDFEEDLYSPGIVEWDVAAGQKVSLSVGCGDDASGDREALELAARERYLAGRAAGDFRIRRPDGLPSVTAGYPWFTDWGRDTLISLPGLCQQPAEREFAREVMLTFCGAMKQGVLPNRFVEGGEPEYNTADASLWLFPALQWFEQAGGDVRPFLPAVREIIEWRERGTFDRTFVDPEDGLLSAGDATTNLTWMDARVDGRPVTPRGGKPVEINALWYNAMCCAARWGVGEASRARRVRRSFAAFWNAERGCLHDVLTVSGPDPSVRPNQIFAVSLHYRPLSLARSQQVVRTVEQSLLTPCGLRTLAPGEPGYCGRYRGGPRERDSAYHQGTVWPWLLGPYLTAYARVFGQRGEAAAYLREWLDCWDGLRGAMCAEHIPEVFDGDAPHRPGGAPAQAWSLAELLRCRGLISS